MTEDVKSPPPKQTVDALLLEGSTQQEREDRLCELVYNGLRRVSEHVRKSMLYSNDMIASFETDAYGKTVRTVYWMGENHLYAIVFLSCHGAPSSDLYNRPYLRSSMGGMQMIGIPGDSISLIVDALWDQIVNRGYKVYSEDCKDEIKSTALHGHEKTGEIVATAASGSNNIGNSNIPSATSAPTTTTYDAQAEEPTEKSKLRRRGQEPETDKNK